MAHVVVTIAGRTYRMSCADGEEARLEQLARYVEGKILSMKEGFGEIGEQRIVVMAALAIADEATDARSRAHDREAEATALRAELGAARQAQAALESRLSAALGEAAGRIEKLTRELQQPPAPRDEPL